VLPRCGTDDTEDPRTARVRRRDAAQRDDEDPQVRAARSLLRRVTDERHQAYLLRHGDTEWVKLGRHTGRTDIPLDAEGEAQATALAARLAGKRFALVLCSPLARARETCRLAGFADQAVYTDDVIEWDYGEYEGRTTLDIHRERPDWFLFRD